MKKRYLPLITMAMFATLLCFSGLMAATESHAQRFKDNLDGTVTDIQSGLIWSKSANPLAELGDMDWYQATQQAETFSLAGYSNWRLPTKQEISDFIPFYFSDDLAREMNRSFVDLPAETRRYWSSNSNYNDDNAFMLSFMIIVQEDEHSSIISISRGTSTAPKSQALGTVWLVHGGKPVDPVTLERANFLFNWLESQFPEILHPAPQTTQGSDGIYFRYYPGTNVYIKAFGNYLYFIDGQGESYNLGGFLYWVGYSKAETLFNWLEDQPELHDLMSPRPQPTQVQDERYFRQYPDTNFTIYTRHGRLFYSTDNFETSHDVGSVDDWLKAIGK